ncbi:MAG: hypothetical protein ACI8RD_008367 [Bacillariaceae sp.]
MFDQQSLFDLQSSTTFNSFDESIATIPSLAADGIVTLEGGIKELEHYMETFKNQYKNK